MIKEIKQGTKQYELILWNYKFYPSIYEHGLLALYKKPSKVKQDAYYKCLSIAKYYGTIKDIKGNGTCQNFSLYISVDTGDNTLIIQFTSSNTRLINIGGTKI